MRPSIDSTKMRRWAEGIDVGSRPSIPGGRSSHCWTWRSSSSSKPSRRISREINTRSSGLISRSAQANEQTNSTRRSRSRRSSWSSISSSRSRSGIAAFENDSAKASENNLLSASPNRAGGLGPTPVKPTPEVFSRPAASTAPTTPTAPMSRAELKRITLFTPITSRFHTDMTPAVCVNYFDDSDPSIEFALANRRCDTGYFPSVLIC